MMAKRVEFRKINQHRLAAWRTPAHRVNISAALANALREAATPAASRMMNIRLEMNSLFIAEPLE
jgi:hypothetical protein